uniref:Uncharacterized protein n=1 Tax=Anopheles dirus TaxID=7168 RepID=A0A182N025_9DIPT
MSRYSRDDPRSIFFSGGSSSTPLRSYAGSDLLKRSSIVPPPIPSQSTPSPTPSTSTPDPPKPEPVVRIIPILYPAQPARLIGGTSSYGPTAQRPAGGDGDDGDDEPPVRSATDGTNTSSPPPPNVTTGILKTPATGAAPPAAGGSPSRVSFSARPAKPTMAGPSGNGVHARTLPLAKASRSVEPPPTPPAAAAAAAAPPPQAAPPPDEGTPCVPAHHQRAHQVESAPPCRMQLALYGWRKKCLYALIFVLMVMIIVNLALTLWIMKVMEFSSVSIPGAWQQV